MLVPAKDRQGIIKGQSEENPDFHHFSPRVFKLENISQHQMIGNFMRNPNTPVLRPFSEILARFFCVKVPRESISAKMAFFHKVNDRKIANR